MPQTRELAVIALNKIFKKSKKPKEVLEELSPGMDRRERAFLMELVYGVLRYRDYLDWVLRDFLRKPSGLSYDTLNNLRLAVYQIKHMRVPEWAVVNEAVEVEKLYKGRESLVNAVLRNFLRHKDKPDLPPEEDPVDYISITTSHPAWLVKRWIKRFGYERALRLAKKNNEIPHLAIRMNNPSERERALRILAEKGISARPTAYSPSGIVLYGTHSFSELSELADFNYIIQDEAAQLVTYLLNPSPGDRILDACAAPGGKTTHIARLMNDKGDIVAVEADLRRIKQIEENISRLGIKSVRIVHGDARDLDKIDNPLFDRILLDAPCSSIGVIRRNPDVKYRHKKKDLQRFKENQLALLNGVSRYLKAGGSMVYSVCSTEPEEGEEVIKEFLHATRNFSIIQADYDFLRQFEVMDSGYLFYRTFPHIHDMDGFFAARLRRCK